MQHLKLPHYVDFQSELVVVRTLRAEVEARREQAALSQAAEWTMPDTIARTRRRTAPTTTPTSTSRPSG